MDWRHHAICRDEDPELFFPIGTSGPALLQVEQAKAVCRRCTVTESCLSWALESGQDAGVWGGMSEDERRAVKRRGGLRVSAPTASQHSRPGPFGSGASCCPGAFGRSTAIIECFDVITPRNGDPWHECDHGASRK